jgi:cytochrome c2
MIQPIAILLLTTAAVQAQGLTADSARGRQLFDSLSCVQCHSMNGKGGSTAPDLGRIVDRGFTPASLAATMWNHAPAMWTAMRQQAIGAGDLNEQAAADLFAYFYSTRFFESPGDAARGKYAFTARGCSKCHAMQPGRVPEAKPVSQWGSLVDPIALTEAMWNHAPLMLAKSQVEREPWPRLTSQELTDILVYLRNLPFPAPRVPEFRTSGASGGEEVFRAKGCAGCHPSAADLSETTRGKTLTDVAARVWNHEPLLAKAGVAPAQFAPDEMRKLVGYLWTQQFFEDAGSASSGRRVFLSKRCAACHESSSSGAPRLADKGRSFSGATMVSVLWHHGPTMLVQMKNQGIAWPRFEHSQMSDLIAFLNSTNGRTP